MSEDRGKRVGQVSKPKRSPEKHNRELKEQPGLQTEVSEGERQAREESPHRVETHEDEEEIEEFLATAEWDREEEKHIEGETSQARIDDGL